jgi:hypothetical protein
MMRILTIALVALAPAIALAQETGVAQGGDPVVEAIFDEIEKRLIREYYEAQRAAPDEDDNAQTGQGKSKAKNKSKGKKKGWVQGIPPGHLPPPGLCRAWLPDTPPGHQPPPTDCASAARDAPAGARLVYGGARGKDDVLPPGLGTRLPDDLLEELPLPYPDTDRLLVDDDVYLVRAGTRIILDVIEGVLTSD